MFLAGYEDVAALAFSVALVAYVLTRLNSGLSREERRKLTSTDSSRT